MTKYMLDLCLKLTDYVRCTDMVKISDNSRIIDLVFFDLLHLIRNEESIYLYISDDSKALKIKDVISSLFNDSKHNLLITYIRKYGIDIDEKDPDGIFDVLMMIAKGNIIHIDLFTPLLLDDRTIDFTWSILRLYSSANYLRQGLNDMPLELSPLTHYNTTDNDGPYARRNYKSHERRLMFNILHLKNENIRIEDRAEDIIHFFDRWNCSEQTKINQIKVIDKLLVEQRKYNDMVNWYKKNKNMTEWAWNYFKTQVFTGTIPLWANEYEAPNFLARQLITAWDLLCLNRDRQALVMLKFKNAASRQKTRIKRETIKPSSFYLSQDTNEKLNSLANHYKTTRTALIEKLICDAHYE